MSAAVIDFLAAHGAKPHASDVLPPGEAYWRDRHDWLKTCGYVLRPRFRPGWTPSWKGDSTKSEFLSEDGAALPHHVLMDAVRVSDNATVVLKKIDEKLHPYEVEIGTFLTSLGPSPANHCVPVLETLHPPDDENVAIIVMPLLRKYDSPQFDTIGEAVEFFRQIFEGLQFLHHQHVAHRDCNSNNVMMDGACLFPQGFHPQEQDRLPDFKPDAPYHTRTRLPVKYYFIDYGISRRYDPANGPPLEGIILGGDKSPPEHAQNHECDPFPTDIYFIGNLIRREFLDGNPEMFIWGRRGFEFMRPLVDDMVQDDPTKRPTIDQVVTRFAEIQQGLWSWKLRSRVIGKREFRFQPDRIISHWYRKMRSIMMRVPAVPVPTS